MWYLLGHQITAHQQITNQIQQPSSSIPQSSQISKGNTGERRTGNLWLIRLMGLLWSLIFFVLVLCSVMVNYWLITLYGHHCSRPTENTGTVTTRLITLWRCSLFDRGRGARGVTLKPCWAAWQQERCAMRFRPSPPHSKECSAQLQCRMILWKGKVLGAHSKAVLILLDLQLQE